MNELSASDLAHRGATDGAQPPRDAFRSTPLPSWIEDSRSGAILDVNDAALEWYGLAREAFLLLTAGQARAAAAGRFITRALAGSGAAARVVTVLAGAVDAPGEDGAARGRSPWQHLDAVPAPIWSARPDGTTDYLNRVLYAFAGETPETLAPEDWSALVHPADRDRAGTLAGTAMAAGEAFACELRLRAADGSYRWHLHAGSPVRDDAGRVVRYYGTLTDVQEMRLVQDALRERGEHLRAILESEPECVKLVSGEGLLLDMNPAGLRMIEAESLDQVVGRPIAELVHPQDRVAFLALHLAALGGEPGRLAYRVIGLAGGERWTESHVTPLNGPGGTAEAVLSVTRDVTQRHHAEAALQEARKRNELILAAAAEGIHGLDRDGRLVFENAAGLAILGYVPGELMGRQSHGLIHHHHADGRPYPAEDCPIYRTLQDGRTRHVDDEVLFRKDGSPVPVEFTCAAMTDADSGEILGAMVSFRDVTARRRDSDLRALEVHVLDMLSAGAPLANVLAEITATVDRLLPEMRSSIQLVDSGGRMHHAAAARLPADFGRAIDGVAAGPRAGSCGTAAFRAAEVVVTDIATDPLWEGPRESALGHGLRACWSTPVTAVEGGVLATIAIYYLEPRGPTPLEREVVGRIGQFVRTAVERHRAMEALKASEERLRTLTEHIQEVFWMTDLAKERMLYISPAYEAIWGRACAELYADPFQWLKAVHEDDRAAVAEAAGRQGEELYVKEYRIVRPDGTVRWVSDRGFPVREADGTVRHIVGTARDITTQKLAECALQERLKELRCLYRVLSLLSDDSRPPEATCRDIAETILPAMLHADVAMAAIELGDTACRSGNWRTPEAVLAVPIRHGGIEIGRVRVGYPGGRPAADGGEGPFLREEIDMIEAVAVHIGRMMHNRQMAARLAHSERLSAIGQLGGGVAHDFNNLLTVIIGNAEILAENLAGDRKLGPLADLTVRAAERGAQLTDRLLAFARRQPLDPQATDVNRLIAGMHELLRPVLAEHVEVALLPGAGLWPALVDAAQLEDALLNLCLNARDAMPRGGRLTIETANRVLADGDPALRGEGEPGPYVVIAVSDSGVGMDETTVNRAFEPFFTTKEPGAGSGLGLSMVYGFAMQSRGFAGIASRPGEGTTVTLHLPQAGGDPTAAVPQRAQAIQHGGERVLLVEDDPMVREHVAAQLRQLGYGVVAAGGGAEALEALNGAGPFALLFTDIVMPGSISGLELAEAAGRLCPGLPVLFTSGHAGGLSHGLFQGLPARLSGTGEEIRLLSKPYRRHELAAALRQALRQDGR